MNDINDTWPYESARADLIAEVRKHRASPAVLQFCIDACRRHLTENTISRAAERGDDPNWVMNKAIVETILELENEFSSSHDGALQQALKIIRDISAK
ncbi:MAG TPA: hypothetical protein VKF82_00955 [Candidatus Eremiobacteraceae bacterium]|nr:hypothetical protein [Candidatus Eremiobacteraceae bacterium]